MIRCPLLSWKTFLEIFSWWWTFPGTISIHWKVESQKSRGQNLDCFTSERILGSSPHSFSLLNHTERPHFWSTLPGERGTTHLRYRVSLHKGTKSAPKGLSGSQPVLHYPGSILASLEWFLETAVAQATATPIWGWGPGMRVCLSSQMIPVYSCIAHKKLLATPNS